MGNLKLKTLESTGKGFQSSQTFIAKPGQHRGRETIIDQQRK